MNSSGNAIVYDLKTSGAKLATARFSNGEIDGTAEVLNARTGKVVSKSNWSHGTIAGQPEKYDEDTGALIASATPSSNGASPNLDACVDKWVAALRNEKGSDAMISADQVKEWEGWCKAGKAPGSQ